MTFKRNVVAPVFVRLICCRCGRRHPQLLGYNGLEVVNVTVAFHQLQEAAAAGLRDTKTSPREVVLLLATARARWIPIKANEALHCNYCTTLEFWEGFPRLPPPSLTFQVLAALR